MPIPLLEKRFWLVRGYNVILDSDLAALYGVLTKTLNQAVKRNARQFPEDFMFQLTLEEAWEIETLKSQSVTSNKRGRRRKYPPYVFTEQGIVMLSFVLMSECAISAHIVTIRTFGRLRKVLADHEELARQLDELRWREEEKGQKIQMVFETIQHLIEIASRRTGQTADSSSERRLTPSITRELALDEALGRLIDIARLGTVQSSRVADLLLAWYNAEENGGWNPVDLWSIDATIADDMLTVLQGLRAKPANPDELGLAEEMQQIWRRWRGPHSEQCE